ncbi:MAG: prepilin peptidase [Bryobacteraceae bacterium]
MIEAGIAFAFGLLIGSFLNVCIHRLPRDLSVVKPRSHCPHCRKLIPWNRNVPLLSFALLRGRCGDCGAPIPLRYPLVELLTGILFAAYVSSFGLSLEAAKLCLAGALLVALMFTDLEQRILPDELTLGGALAAFAFAWFVPVRENLAAAVLSIFGAYPDWRLSSLAESALGASLPAGFLWLGGFLFEKIRHKEGLGFGDVKMMVMIGAFFGFRGALLALVLGSLLGSVVGLIYIWAAGKEAATYPLPFGTFLGMGALVVSLFGPDLIAWHENLLVLQP